MQLSLNNRIAAAASGMLGVISAPLAVAEKATWLYDITGFNYAESNGRVDDKAIKAQATRTTESEQTISFGVSYDALTGASAGGQVAADGSGRPVLTDIDDNRSSANVSISQPLTPSLTGSAGLSYSSENDYQHRGVNVSLTREFNDKNSSLGLAYAHAQDSIEGVAGNPIARATIGTGKIGEQDKMVDDVVVGLTQVLSKTAIGQLNYSYSQSSGYLNDPYKGISVVDRNGVPQSLITESRPDDRNGHSVYSALNLKLSTGVLKPSYRYYTDDWGIDSHTLELKYAVDLGQGRTLEPRIRYYTQSEADFYRGQLQSGEPIAQYISSDYRLDQFNAVTLGLQYRWKDTRGFQWRVGLDYYTQSTQHNTDQLTGQSELNPGISATMFRIGVTF